MERGLAHGGLRDVQVTLNLLGLVGLVVAGTLPTFAATAARMRMSERATAARRLRLLVVQAGALAMTSAGLATGAIDLAAVGLAVYAAEIVELAGLLPRPGRRQLTWAGPRLVGLWAGMSWWVAAVVATTVELTAGAPPFAGRWLVVLALAGYGQILWASLAYLGPVLRGGDHGRLTRNLSLTRWPLGLAAANTAGVAAMAGMGAMVAAAVAVWVGDTAGACRASRVGEAALLAHGGHYGDPLLVELLVGMVVENCLPTRLEDRTLASLVSPQSSGARRARYLGRPSMRTARGSAPSAARVARHVTLRVAMHTDFRHCSAARSHARIMASGARGVLHLEERPMDADVELEGFEVLSRQECEVLLTRGCVGRVGFVVGGRPQVLPVNYAADDAGVVVFRTSANSILMAVAMQAVVFEVDGLDEAHRTGWSVCVHGSAREITEREDPIAQRLRTLAVIPWAPGHRQRWFAITPDEITGRRLPVQGMAEGLGGWYPGVPS